MNLPNLSKYPNAFNLALAGFLTFSLLLIALTINQVGSLQSEAAKGGIPGKPDNSGKGGGKDTCCTVTMSIDPNPAIVGKVSIVSGIGFTPGAAVNFVVGGSATYARADENGYASSPWTFGYEGEWTVSAKEYQRRGYELVGQITFQVVNQ